MRRPRGYKEKRKMTDPVPAPAPASSPRGALNSTDWKKIAKGAALASAGAALTFAAEALPQVDFGEYTPFVVGIVTVLLNAVRKALEGPPAGGA